MSAMTLIIDQRGSRLELVSRGIVRVHYQDGATDRVGLRGLQRIILVGDNQISTRLLRACQEAGVGMVLLPRRGKQMALNLYPGSTGSIHLRHSQHYTFADRARRLALAQRLVDAKIEEQQRWLEVHECQGHLLERFRNAVWNTEDTAALMGVEGAASARYFKLWGRLWQTPWQFSGRNRRPPRDPINALLSLGYTLALQYVGRLATLRSLDPAIGFLHTPKAARPTLALDLLEPVRPWVDQWVWQILNSQQSLRPEHFTETAAEGCRLNKEGRALFFEAWHRTERRWLRGPARHSLAILINELRPMRTARWGDFADIESTSTAPGTDS